MVPVANDDQDAAAKVQMLEEMSLYLFDLANTIHEHRDMLFRLSDTASAQANKLRRQLASVTGSKTAKP